LYHQNPLKQLTSRDNEDVSAENLKKMLQNVPKSTSSTQEKEDLSVLKSRTKTTNGFQAQQHHQ
jgi:hypothetical protein